MCRGAPNSKESQKSANSGPLREPGGGGVRAQRLVPQREVWNYGAMNHEVTDENEGKKKENITLENMIGSKIGLGKTN